jgi:hypothetical protein
MHADDGILIMLMMMSASRPVFPSGATAKSLLAGGMLQLKSSYWSRIASVIRLLADGKIRFMDLRVRAW